MTDRSEWRIVPTEGAFGFEHVLDLGPDVWTEVHIVVPSDDPGVLAAIETAAARAGLTLERVEA